MKFLVDHQLPVALARWLAAKGVDAVHVLDRGWDRTPDEQLWAQADGEGRIVVSKDEDFFHLANRSGDTGRVLWVRLGNCRTAALLCRFSTEWTALTQVFASGQRIVELR